MKEFFGILLVMIGCFLGGVVAGSTTLTPTEKDIVDKGHGRYYLDENHKKQFEWNPPCTAEKLDAYIQRLIEEDKLRIRKESSND